ncbi:hypothetical protein [Methylorubrum populi]|uniref:Glycoside hydrolase n=1 Tax=Methylorubrum populi TaxID=223967 RepID=A0A833J494_9HYPH|nr:hypothetical protein [Methylorubrum populi]KAB7783834.1 hypothetical protein F8B43_3757 [Methylorubrum populi]
MQKQSKLLFVSTALMVMMLTSQSSAGTSGLVIGVNQTRLAWTPKWERDAILQSIASEGVKVIRIPLHEPFATTLDIMREAKSLSLGVIVDISFNLPKYYDPDVQPRQGDKAETSYPLSRLNLSLFEKEFKKFWDSLESDGLQIDAIQIGNEINWTFNGDVLVSQNAPGRVSRSVDQMPNAAAFREGLTRYVAAAKVVRKLRDMSKINRQTSILSAGMARIDDKFARSTGAISVTPTGTLLELSSMKIDEIIDGRAIHVYVRPETAPPERLAIVYAAVDECRVGSQNARPCWVTEWGVNNFSTTCPVDDKARAQVVHDVRKALDRSAASGKLSAAIYFEWAGPTPRSIWRCGALTPAGVAALR